jgi:RNA polymerase sigma factor (TIGR02999 family)
MALSREDTTQLLVDWRQGDGEARALLFDRVYAELVGMARGRMRGEPTALTLEASDLVHETFFKLVHLERIDWQSRAHFLGVAATAMRQVLIDHARRRRSGKRRVEARLTLQDDAGSVEQQPVEILDLERALAALAEVDPARAELVALRIYGGLSVEETAEVLGCTDRTVKRRFRSSIAWLRRYLGGASYDEHGDRDRD